MPLSKSTQTAPPKKQWTEEKLPVRGPESSTHAFVHANRYFIGIYLLFLLPVAALLHFYPLGDLEMALNVNRSGWADLIFTFGTLLGEWPAYVLLLGVLIYFVSFRAALMLPLIGLFAGVFSGLLKLFFAHARPTTWFWEQGLYSQLNIFDDSTYPSIVYTSFPSGHAASAFALYGFVAFSIGRYRGLGALLAFLAIQVAFSRIYLLMHFLEDVMVGSLLGLLIALGCYYLQFYVFPDKIWLDDNFSRRRTRRIQGVNGLPPVDQV